jgi:hypothetical protein
LVFLEKATGLDLLKGMLHACIIKQRYSLYLQQKQEQQQQDDKDKVNYHYSMISQTYTTANEWFPQVLQSIHQVGWNTNTDVTIIEPRYAKRLSILRSSSSLSYVPS